MYSKGVIYFLIIISYIILTNAMAKKIPDNFVCLLYTSDAADE